MSAFRSLPLTALATFGLFAAFDAHGTKASNAEEASASAFLNATHQAISTIRQNEQHNADEQRALIEHLLSEKLDLATMARLALGAREKAFSRTELSEFVQEYSRFLIYTYLREIAWSRAGAIPTIASTTVDAKTGWVTIATKAEQRSSIASQRGQFRQASHLRVDYWLRERHGDWRIAKVTFNGVDLNRSFGSQFEAVLQRSTPEELLSDLQQLNTRRNTKNPLE